MPCPSARKVAERKVAGLRRSVSPPQKNNAIGHAKTDVAKRSVGQRVPVVTAGLRRFSLAALLLGCLTANAPAQSPTFGSPETAETFVLLSGVSAVNVQPPVVPPSFLIDGWYLNPHTKFQFNHIYSMLDKPVGPGAGDSDAGIYAMRAQIEF